MTTPTLRFDEGMRLAEAALKAPAPDLCVLRDLATTFDLEAPTTPHEVKRFVNVIVRYFEALAVAVPDRAIQFNAAADDFRTEAAAANYDPDFVETSQFMTNADLGAQQLAALAWCPVHDGEAQ